MSIFANIFSGNKPQPSQQPQGQPNQQPVQPPSNEPTMASKDPGQPVNGSNPPPDPSTMWNKLWDTSNTGEKADAPPQLSLDPKVLDEVSGKMDFMSGVNPDMLQKATSGDVQALLDIIQHVGRNSYRQSLQHTGALTNEFVTQREGYFSKQLPSQIKSHLTDNMLAEGGGKAPPFIQQQMKDVAQRVQRANPDATPAQIQGMVQQYMQELAGYAQQTFGASGNSGQSSQPKAEQPVNWDNWFKESQ